MKPEPLIESAFLEKLERLAVRWQKSFPGLVGGHNASRFSGPGQEFLDHRHFHHGDDLRAVNWRAFLRLEKLFLKMFQIEPRVPVRLMLDISRSMETGGESGGISKFDYARKLAAALSYVGLVRLDTICLQPFAGELYDSFVCSGGRHRFAPAVEYLSALTPRGTTRFLPSVRQFLTRYPQRGLVLIVSDFLDDGDCERPLQFLADYGHEVTLVHIQAEEDRTPPWSGQLHLQDAESGDKLEIAFDDEARLQYTAAFDEYSRNVQRAGLRNGGRYVPVSTATALEEAVFGPLIRAGAVQ